MSNRTYVCFDCRTTERVSVARITRTCRKCRKQAEHVYYKFKIPKRADDAGWRELEAKVRTYNRRARSYVLPRLRQERTKLERLLSEMPKSKPDRRRSLSFKLKNINEYIRQWSLW